MFDDLGGYDVFSDIGIDPGSIDYSGVSGLGGLSNEDLWNQLNGMDWVGYTGSFDVPDESGVWGSGLGALQAMEGSPNINSVSEADMGAARDASINAAAAASERQNPVLRALGFKGTADGTATDWADPQTLSQLMKLIGVGGNFLSKLASGRQAQKQQSQSSALQQALAQQAQRTWTPQQQAMVNDFFNRGYAPASQRRLIYAGDTPSTIVPGKGYAGGGEVEAPLSMAGAPAEEAPLEGPLGLVAGATDGQADLVPANLGHGEYVIDADVVAALGNGNNEAGAKALDRWRENIRRHKRSAPADKIPPKAKTPDAYLKGAK